MTNVKLTGPERAAIAARNGVTPDLPPQNLGEHVSAVYVVNPSGDSGSPGTSLTQAETQAAVEDAIAAATEVGPGTADAAQRMTLASNSPGLTNLAAIGLASDEVATTSSGLWSMISLLKNLPLLLFSIGLSFEPAAESDAGGFSLIALVKRGLRRLSNIYAVLCTGSRSGGAPADNAVISGTITAPSAGQYIHFTGYSVSFSANPSAARALTITAAGGATLADIDFTTGGAGPVSLSVSAPPNTAVTFSLAASGTAGNIGKLSLYHTTLSVI